ncbi:MAG: hypothetical protein EBV92_09070, partial [Betaproteobacteria bacterium]|nr:hypothetical protein [Betaproteobacteria bacterium]
MEGVEPLKAWMLDPLTQALSLVDRPRPEPGPQQVLIQVRAASLNRGEFLVGMAVAGGAAAPKPCGMEATGEVIAIGAEAATTLRFPLQIGSRVMGRSPGGFAQYALIEAQDLLPVPDQLSWFEAACIPIAYLVAYDMVVVGGDLKPGQSCLVTAVSSGVGVACLQMAQAGMLVTSQNVSGSSVEGYSKRDASYVIDSMSPNARNSTGTAFAVEGFIRQYSSLVNAQVMNQQAQSSY